MRKRRTTKKAPVRAKRRVTRRKKGMLSELFNPAMATAGGRTVLSGAIGGAGAAMLNKLLPDTMDPKTKAFYTIGAGFVTATMMKLPNVGAGMSGVGMFNLLTAGGFLAENGEIGFDYADPIEALPVVLDENGADYLQDNGMYLADNGLYLAEENDYSYDVGYYGAGFGLDNVN
jgi:hypothetical protein